MAAPDFTFIDGFDKYGPLGFVPASATIDQLLGEWTASFGPGSLALAVVASLNGAGQALKLTPVNTLATFSGISKTLPGNYARMLGGAHIASALTAAANGITFLDNGTQQLSIVINLSGQIEVRRGSLTGTLLGTSTETIAANTAVCIEWDITIHNTTGIAKIWLNGVATSIALTGQNTRASSNSYLNQIQLTVGQTSSAASLTVDHLYCWCYTSSGGSETPALTNPIVETQFPTSDSSVQFAFGAGLLGPSNVITGTTSSGSANRLFLRKYRAQANATLGNVRIVPSASSAGAKFKGVVYSDSAGAPNSLLTSGTEVVGVTADTPTTLPLVTPQSITAGTDYWVGYITDTSVAFNVSDTTSAGYSASNTYTSGAPGTAPAMTSGIGSQAVCGLVTGVSVNWPELDENPFAGNLSYVSSSTVNDQDLFGFPALGSTPTNIYTVAVKSAMVRSDAGARTVDLRTKSSATTASGSSAGQTPSSAAYSFLSSYFATDPNTSAAWTATAVNAATGGYKIAS